MGLSRAAIAAASADSRHSAAPSERTVRSCVSVDCLSHSAVADVRCLCQRNRDSQSEMSRKGSRAATHVQSVQTTERLAAPLADIGLCLCCMQSLVSPEWKPVSKTAGAAEWNRGALAVVLPCKTLVAPGPFAQEGSLRRMRAKVSCKAHECRVTGDLSAPPTSQIKSTSECAAATWDRTHEVCLVTAPTRTRSLGGTSRYLLLLDLQDGRQAGEASGRRGRQRGSAPPSQR